MSVSDWSFKQRFALRASTMLLLSLPLLYAVNWLASLLPNSVSRPISLFVGAAFSAGGFIALLVAIFGLALFIASALKKNPQLQFFVEFLAGGAYVFFMPTY